MEKFRKNSLKINIIQLAKTYRYEEKHCWHVASLSVSLFDQLISLHHLGEKERGFLESAAILHDIGWIKGQQKHHKTSCDLIVQSQKLKIPESTRVIIGLIARYHRKSLPKNSHKYFSDLNDKAKTIVKTLASFLRIADGFDRQHQSSVKKIICKITPKQITLYVQGKNILSEDVITGKEKADLLKNVFKKTVRIIPD